MPEPTPTSGPASSHLRVERPSEGVALLVLDNPGQRNAMSDAMTAAWVAAVDELAADRSLRAVVVTGEGSAFCAGGDTSWIASEPDASVDHLRTRMMAFYRAWLSIRKLEVPTIAAVNGPAIGAGTQLAIACDLRVADETARFAVPTARNGMAVDGWTIRTLAMLAGTGRARRLMLAADSLDRDESLAAGLADRAGTLDDALAWAQEVAELAPLALAHNKLVLNGGNDEAVNASFEAVWASDDVREAAAARSEKRAPNFTGQ